MYLDLPACKLVYMSEYEPLTNVPNSCLLLLSVTVTVDLHLPHL